MTKTTDNPLESLQLNLRAELMARSVLGHREQQQELITMLLSRNGKWHVAKECDGSTFTAVCGEQRKVEPRDFESPLTYPRLYGGGSVGCRKCLAITEGK